MMRGEELYSLIPQRPPIVMVDGIDHCTGDEADTTLTLTESNLFVSGGALCEAGIIEHIAQSIAAFAGFQTYAAGLPPRLGYIGEIKQAHFYARPLPGQTLRTHIRVLGEAEGVTLVHARTWVEEKEIADCKMKIFLDE